MKVSIIIPIYNSEKTLSKCLESVVQQSYKNLEIILVNDGSRDKSEEICNKYKKIDRRIVLVNKKNEGVSIARNTGILKSTGEYIQFLDSDDFIEKDMTEILVKAIRKNGTDLVICGYNLILTEGIIYKNFVSKKDSVKIEEYYNYFWDLYNNHLLNLVWNKLYKKDKIIEMFSKNIHLGEDLLFNLKYMDNIKKISIISKCLYNYKRDEDLTSLSTKYRRSNIDNGILVLEYFLDFCNKNYNSKFDYKTLYNRRLEIMLEFVYSLVSNETKKDYILKKLEEFIRNKKIIFLCENSQFKIGEKSIIKKIILSNHIKFFYNYCKIRKILVFFKRKII